MKIFDYYLFLGGVSAIAAAVTMLGAAFQAHRTRLEMWLLAQTSLGLFGVGAYCLYALLMLPGAVG